MSSAHVHKVNPLGSSVTQWMGMVNSVALTVATGPSGELFVAGAAYSGSPPTQAHGFQEIFGGGGSDAFVAKIAPVTLVTVSPGTLDFGELGVGETASKPVTLTNSGETVLCITSIEPSGDFSQTNDCGESVALNGSCVMSVMFEPTAVGPRVGTLTIVTNALGSPHVIDLSGRGTSFTIEVQPGGLTSALVSAADSAVFHLQLGGTPGAAGTATLGCMEDIPAASCAVSPTSVGLNDTAPSKFTVTVGANVPAVAQRAPPAAPTSKQGNQILLPTSWMWFAALALMSGILAASHRRARLAFMAAMLFVVVWSSCGGNSRTLRIVPPGSYNISVTATVNGVTKAQVLVVNFY